MDVVLCDATTGSNKLRRKIPTQLDLLMFAVRSVNVAYFRSM
jgi:hypothetical protein